MTVSQNSSPVGSAALESISAAAIVDQIKSAGVEFVLTVPDITTSESVLTAFERDGELRHIKVCKEDECFGISAGLSFCGKRSLVLIQNTGLFDSINALRAIGGEYSMPLCIMAGLLEKEPEALPKDSAIYGVRITQPILDAMGIKHHLIETPADAAIIGPAIKRAYENSTPIVFLLGRSPKAVK